MTLSFGGGAGVLTIPGLTSDGADGITVTGAITAGTVAANGGAFPDDFELTGAINLHDATGTNPDGDSVLGVLQTQGFSVNQVAPTVYIRRSSSLNGHTCSGPVVHIIDQTGTTANIMELDGTGPGTIKFGQAGGIGVFGHAAPAAAASITGALSTVTDAAAKNVLTAIIAALTGDGSATDNTT